MTPATCADGPVYHFTTELLSGPEAGRRHRFTYAPCLDRLPELESLVAASIAPVQALVDAGDCVGTPFDAPGS